VPPRRRPEEPPGPPGVALVRDERGGVTITVDGLPQSHVQPDDPGLLVFEYVQHLGLVLDALPPGRLAVTHIGGAGLTLPRYVQLTRPGSPQVVLEPDTALTDLVRRELPLPRGHRIRVRPVDGATGVRSLADDSADVVVVDAYQDGRVPPPLLGSDFLTDVARVLAPDGLALLNIADAPGLRYLSRVAATVRQVLPVLSLVATHEVLKGRRFGNTVLVAARTADRVADLDLPRGAASCPFPTGVWGPERMSRWIGTVVPFGPVGEPGPEPPPATGWRAR
jgi:spermidine synthase